MTRLWNKKRGPLFTILGFILAMVLGVCYLFFGPVHGDRPKEAVAFTVDDKMTGNEIVENMYQKGIIWNRTFFRIALRVVDAENKLQGGVYSIPYDINAIDLIELLQKGEKEMIAVTIPEGFTIFEIAKRLEEKQIVSKDDFLTEAKVYVPYLYMYGPTPEEYHVEGFLYPETYHFAKDTPAREVIQKMTQEMNSKLTPDMKKRIEERGLSIYQFITLASIVEREALFDEDRPLIAAVFLKRLHINMPLQSCATIEYVLGERKAILSEADTLHPSPYNTYKFYGLPPGPISNPGIKAMEAVLDAKDTEFLYFVADKEGHHHFSKTYTEHLNTIASIYGN